MDPAPIIMVNDLRVRLGLPLSDSCDNKEDDDDNESSSRVVFTVT